MDMVALRVSPLGLGGNEQPKARRSAGPAAWPAMHCMASNTASPQRTVSTETVQRQMHDVPLATSS
jgi:hypothetical protein